MIRLITVPLFWYHTWPTTSLSAGDVLRIETDNGDLVGAAFSSGEDLPEDMESGELEALIERHDLNLLSDEEHARYNEAIKCGASHETAMEAATF